jgi:hypothetical protein
MRAARLALQLTRAASWCDAFTVAGGVAAAVRLTGPGAGNPALPLAGLRLLQRLAGATPTSGAALALVRQQLLDALMAMLLQPLATAATGSAALAAAKSGSRPDASKVC